MSHIYAPSPVILANFTLPDDITDQRSAASVNAPFEKLADAMRYEHEHASRKNCTVPFFPVSRTPAALGPSTFPTDGDPVTGADVTLRTIGTVFKTANIASTNGFVYTMPIPPGALIDGNTLTEVLLRTSAGTPHTALPQLMQRFGIARIPQDISAIDQLYSVGTGYVVDSSGSVAALDAIHDILYVPNQNNLIDNSQYFYVLFFQQEGGTNAKVDGRVLSVQFGSTRP